MVGRDIKKAGLLGQVLGTVPLTKEHLKTVFRSVGTLLRAAPALGMTHLRLRNMICQPHSESQHLQVATLSACSVTRVLPALCNA